jgi:hypothetical protein
LIAQTRFAENLKPTAILDWEALQIRTLAATLRQECTYDRDLVRSAHGHLAESVRPIYTLQELQPASVTLHKQRGSCSQRMACLEAIARAAGVPTRVRALRVRGQFWYPRFRAVGMFLPKEVMLIWPQFLLENEWTDISEIYAPVVELAKEALHRFQNDGESIFDAVNKTPIDFAGKTCTADCPTSEFDLSRFVLADEGPFATRDEVFERFGLLQKTFKGRAFELLFGGRKSV